MSLVDGIYKCESSSGKPASFAALGIPEAELKKHMDPKNEITVQIYESSPDCYQFMRSVSLQPEWNEQGCLKLGEVKEFTKPFPYSFTLTKKDENTFVNTMEMNGKTMVQNMSFNNYGLVINGKILGTEVTLTEVFKRVTPQISGYYIYESETGIEGLLKALGIATDDLASVTTGSAFSLTEVGDRLDTVEFFGGVVKRASFPYNKEFDYQRPDWNVDDKRIVTKIAPGVVKTVCKSKTTGSVWEYTMSFNSRGVVIRSKANGAESVETYKRGVHTEGVWRVVSQTGVDSFAEALGMTGEMKKKFCEDSAREVYNIQRLMGGAVEVKCSSPFLPAVTVIKSGEEYVTKNPYGEIRSIGHELNDQWIFASKSNGKTISTDDKFSGDFMIREVCVDGIKSSSAVTIFARD